jgi:hypothetical protein
MLTANFPTVRRDTATLGSSTNVVFPGRNACDERFQQAFIGLDIAGEKNIALPDASISGRR